MSGTPGNCISGPDAGSAFTTVTCLPSARSAYAAASSEPMESPSGRACDAITKRWLARMISTILLSSGFVMGFWRLVRAAGVRLVRANLVQNLLDAILAGNGLVEDERQFRRPPQPQPRPDLT